tara:strand:+ start:1377 stop:1535 length:159 start_codon:yes stop_codon:yes gene_type:complete
MSGKKDKKAINLIGGTSSGTSKSRKKIAAKSKRRSAPKRKVVKTRTRGRSGR